MLDLIHLWHTTTSGEPAEERPSQHYPSDTKPAAIKFDESTTQSGFAFTTPPKVVFVKNKATLERADFYHELPEIPLTGEENEARLRFVAEQAAKNPRFYDGKQMVITGVIFDDATNVLYMEARQVPYSFIVSLSQKKFPEGSALYDLTVFKTGVLAPLVSRDGASILFQRAAHGLFSVPGGFLETHGEEKRLNFDDGRNLVTETAITEIKEEVAGVKGTDDWRFNISNTGIGALSFRRTGSNPIGTIEFVAPSRAHCLISDVEHVFETNSAEDAHEHTSESVVILLNRRDRGALLEQLFTGTVRLPGEALFAPVAHCLAALANPDSMMLFPRKTPGSSSVTWPLSMFTARAERPLSILDVDKDAEPEEKQDKTDGRGCSI